MQGSLRDHIIRLAAARPDLRAHLLPLLARQMTASVKDVAELMLKLPITEDGGFNTLVKSAKFFANRIRARYPMELATDRAKFLELADEVVDYPLDDKQVEPAVQVMRRELQKVRDGDRARAEQRGPMYYRG